MQLLPTIPLEHMGQQRCFKLRYQKVDATMYRIPILEGITLLSVPHSPSLLVFLMLWEMTPLSRYQCYKHTSLQQQLVQLSPMKSQVLCLKDVLL